MTPPSDPLLTPFWEAGPYPADPLPVPPSRVREGEGGKGSAGEEVVFGNPLPRGRETDAAKDMDLSWIAPWSEQFVPFLEASR